MCGLKNSHTQKPKRDITAEMELNKHTGKRRVSAKSPMSHSGSHFGESTSNNVTFST